MPAARVYAEAGILNKRPELFEFEGAQRSLTEVCALVPCLSRVTVNRYLRQGMTTRAQMTAVNPSVSIRRTAAKRNAERRRAALNGGA